MVAALARVIAVISKFRESEADDFETFSLLLMLGLAGLVLASLAARFGLDASWAFF